MDDRYVPDYREDDDPSERRLRSPSRFPRDLEARLIPRTPNPYLATEFAPRVSDPSPWAQRERRQRSKAPGRIFEGLRFHCFSSTEDGEREAKMMSSKLRREGGKGCMRIRDAEVVIVFPRDSKPLKTVKSQFVPPFHGRRDDDMTVEQMYFLYAARVNPTADRLSANRKYVVQAEWATRRLKQGRWLPEQNSDEWEIMVDNTAAAPLQYAVMQEPFSAAPLLSTPSLPEILSQTLPSFEYRPSEPVKSPASPFASTPVSTVPPKQPLSIEVGQETTEAPPLTPPLVPEMEPAGPSSSQRLVPEQTWTPPVSHATPLTPFVALPQPLPSPVQPVARISVDPRLPSLAAVTIEPVSAPRTITPVSAASRQRTVTESPAQNGPISQIPVMPMTDRTPQPLLRKEPTPIAQAPRRARHNPEGVFAKGHVMPWTFHVLNADRHRSVVRSIERLGGGRIVPFERASIVVLPESGIRVASTPEQLNLVALVEDHQALVSMDWVDECVDIDELIPLDPYRIVTQPDELKLDADMAECTETPEYAREAEPTDTAPIGKAIEVEASVDVKMEVETVPIPTSVMTFAAPTKRPIQQTRTPSAGLRRGNATPGPSGTRHSIAPRQIIKIEDDDDDDCIMLDEPPLPVKKRPRPSLETSCPPTPPRTPFTDVADAQSASGWLQTSTTSNGPKIDELDDEDDDDVPLKKPRKQWKHGSTEVPADPPLITDPVERERMLDRDLPTGWRQPFEQLEVRLREWGATGFAGSYKAFFERTRAELGTTLSWRSIFRNYRFQFNLLVPDLRKKGHPDKRGPKLFLEEMEEIL